MHKLKLCLFKVAKSDVCIRPLLQIQSHIMYLQQVMPCITPQLLCCILANFKFVDAVPLNSFRPPLKLLYILSDVYDNSCMSYIYIIYDIVSTAT